MTISEYYSDAELISQLRMFFDAEEDVDFQSCIGQIQEVDEETYEVKIKGRTFRFDKEFCDVEEVE